MFVEYENMLWSQLLSPCSQKVPIFLVYPVQLTCVQRSWMHGLWVPKGCQPLVITQIEELEIIQSCLQCLVLDYFGIIVYFQCQLELFLLFWCYVPFIELLYELYSMNMGKSITVIVYIVYTVLYCKLQYIYISIRWTVMCINCAILYIYIYLFSCYIL